MNELWPRMSGPLARASFEQLGGMGIRELAASSRADHPQETFAATGGVRARPGDIERFAKAVRDTAMEFGYPERAGDQDRIAFDRAAAEVVYRAMTVTTVEASNRGVWNFLAVVVMPDVTQWRFGRDNVERWVATDLTRHMFSRLWWQALTFGSPTEVGGIDFSLLRRLSESDLNQLTERRSIGGNPRLARALARAVLESDAARREVIREVTPKLRRRLAFIDFSSLSDSQIDDQIRSLI
jgi:hypothetical protein